MFNGLPNFKPGDMVIAKYDKRAMRQWIQGLPRLKWWQRLLRYPDIVFKVVSNRYQEIHGQGRTFSVIEDCSGRQYEIPQHFLTLVFREEKLE